MTYVCGVVVSEIAQNNSDINIDCTTKPKKEMNRDYSLLEANPDIYIHDQNVCTYVQMM